MIVPYCSDASEGRGETLHATASVVRRWLLVEAPGSWGRDAVRDSRIGAEVGRRLLALGRELGARVIAIRRHGRHEPHDLCAFVASTAPGARRVEHLALGSAADLLDLDLGPLADDRSVGGEPVGHPLYLVCTNGRHDVCCALRGRPLAEALSAVRPRETWECSHIGGDRFAGNLVVLPQGRYLGRVGPADAVAVVEALERGALPLQHDRGRAGLAFPVQAAEHALRVREQLLGLDDVQPVRWERDGDVVRVLLRAADGRTFTATVVTGAAPPALLTCTAREPDAAPAHHVIALEPAS